MDKGTLHRWSRPDTILVATTLQDAPHLVPHAIAQARQSDGKVLLAHVIEPVNLETSQAEGPCVLPSPTVRSVQAELNRVVKQFQQEGVLCEPFTLKGVPQKEIVALIRQRGADRVIVGTSSADAMDRILLGSVAEDLLHQVDIPVCVIGPRVRPQIHPDHKPSSILFATSFRHKSQQGAQFALEIANLYQARLTLLHVMPFESVGTQEYFRLQAWRKEELLDLINKETKLWSSPSIAIRGGDAATEILAEAAKISADLIVLGTAAASKAARLLRTGVVHRVIAKTKAPVMTLRRERNMSRVHSILQPWQNIEAPA